MAKCADIKPNLESGDILPEDFGIFMRRENKPF